MTQPLTDAITALTRYANETTGASDTTLSDAVETLVEGYGQGGGDIFRQEEVSYGTYKWQASFEENQRLADGYVFEMEIEWADVSGFPMIGAIGKPYNYEYQGATTGDIGGWLAANVVSFYMSVTGSNIAVIINKVRQNIHIDDPTTRHTLKVDKDNVYVDGNIVGTTPQYIVTLPLTGIGSIEGIQRWQGTYHLIRYGK